MRVLIVGGVAGGASTAARLRRLNESAEIVIYEKGKEISYANCGIPYHIGNVIKERDSLVVVSKENFEKMFNVKVFTETEVLEIDRKNKKIKVKDLKSGSSREESYDKLVLSPGGYPVKPPIPGINDKRIFSIRNLSDMDMVKKFISERNPRKAVVVGAGFIGLEMAENLHMLGINVSIVELAGQVMNLLDFEMAAAIHQHLKSKKIELYLNDGVKEFLDKNEKLELILQSGRKIEADIVILSIGVKPDIELAQKAGLKIGLLSGIKVNEKMETSDPEIYALGDATEIIDSVCNCPALIPLANSANKQGRIVAENICGGKETYKGTPGTAIAKVFDMTVAITGGSEKKLKKLGLPFEKAYLQPSSHAGYYPNAYPMIMKLLYSPKDGRVLGSQIIGNEGIDKRIDIIASIIQSQKTVYDLAELELAYAPPYSSAKDPVNLAGMIAINQIKGINKVVYIDEIENLQKEGAIFIDARTALEYSLGHIDGAKNIPLSEIRERMKEIPKDKKVILYCNHGKIAYFAFSILLQNGYTNVYNISGGYKMVKFISQNQENTGIFDGSFIDKNDEMKSNIPLNGKIYIVDASGMQCPGPIMKISEIISEKNEGDIIEITATDPGFSNDVGVWCNTTGNTLLSLEDKNGKIIAKVQKGGKQEPFKGGPLPNDKTIIVFSSDFDRAIASFVIANGALSMGRKVTMFFTFWGLNVLRKKKSPKISKDFFSKMFGFMMPKGTTKLKLSKMNFFGAGTILMKHIMKKKNINSLEEFMESAKKSGARLVACQMSMDMMGIKKEELIDGVEIGGVAAYLGAAESADTNLFI